MAAPVVHLPYPRRLDAGPWFTAGERLDGPAADERVRAERTREAGRPYAVYAHVPFCRSICSFCALYTTLAGPDAESRFDEFTDAVLRSLEGNPWTGSAQPPTTVHFGGGTPLSVGTRRFGTIANALAEAFGTSSACEWAVETTTSSLDGETLDALEALRFRRIHVGIQTLDDRTRSRVGRRESGDRAVECIAELRTRGFQPSVDLILGLDGVDARIVEQDIRRLHEAGVRMFSVCELRERNRLDDEQRTRRNYELWQTVWRLMEEAGLMPIHSGQFGRGQADNLYFTHPARGEDCVAIGPYSHGAAGRIAYGNRLLPEYCAAVRSGATPISMGVDYGAAERVVCALERDLLAHNVSQTALGDVFDSYGDRFLSILESWFGRSLVRATGEDTGLALTASGSWFVGNMILELRGMCEAGSRGV